MKLLKNDCTVKAVKNGKTMMVLDMYDMYSIVNTYV